MDAEYDPAVTQLAPREDLKPLEITQPEGVSFSLDGHELRWQNWSMRLGFNLLDSVRRICLELQVVGIDVVEVSPPYDHAEITAALANRVVLEALSAVARKRRDERDGTSWDRSRPLLSERAAPIPLGGGHQNHR